MSVWEKWLKVKKDEKAHWAGEGSPLEDDHTKGDAD